jgi:hypothetical protein
MTSLRFKIFGGVFMFWALVGVAMAQMEHHDSMGIGATAPRNANDNRVALGLKPAAEDSLKQTMREHLEALNGIVAALGKEEFEKAAAVAHVELGFPKHHQAMQREKDATFPPKYQELAMAHHQAAEDLAGIIPSKDMKKILPHLDRTMKACVTCHQAYKL